MSNDLLNACVVVGIASGVATLRQPAAAAPSPSPAPSRCDVETSSSFVKKARLPDRSPFFLVRLAPSTFSRIHAANHFSN